MTIWSINVAPMPAKENIMPRSKEKERSVCLTKTRESIKCMKIWFAAGTNSPAGADNASRKAMTTLVSCMVEACANRVLFFPIAAIEKPDNILVQKGSKNHSSLTMNEMNVF